ncbi:acyl-CoA dehydrogenase family protein [Mesoterricola silvestris]|uniref:Butyryl-CoA dehydrogenase n=1 Tax=Mesoterricola silvestris TaxID=2927979 RepID=A0AA48KDQ9_9BACT|nr:acyl-CoA dehydrogenase family protein [Mesoterricola silvestris]BDU74693.1 butyryl-CoA dehydrogenase [Mesoterricola silvestris]
MLKIPVNPEMEPSGLDSRFSALTPTEPSQRQPFDRDWWRDIGASGMWRIPVPPAMGGVGLSWVKFGSALFDLGLKMPDLGLLLSLVAHAGMIRMVMIFADDEQEAELLPGLMDGRCIGATAITEQSGGSDVRAIRTTAVPAGDGYRITGRKCHVTNAPTADTLIVVSKIATHKEEASEVGLFLFDRHCSGVSFETPEDMIGHQSSPTGGFTMDAMDVGPVSLLGGKTFPLEHLFKALALDRALYAVCCSAVMESALERSLQRTTSREAFGKQLIEHQYVQKHLTDIILAKDVARVIGFEALAKIDADSPDQILACSIAKLVASDGLITATQACMHAHGHEGYLQNEISRMALDALGSWFAAGTNDIQRLSILKQHLRLRRGNSA